MEEQHYIEGNSEELYISNKKKFIDELIEKNDFKQAFMQLILALDILNNSQKCELIDYYCYKFYN